jgi:hypothetical protein
MAVWYRTASCQRSSIVFESTAYVWPLWSGGAFTLTLSARPTLWEMKQATEILLLDTPEKE